MIYSITTGFSLAFPSLPTTLDFFLISSLKSLQTNFVANFFLSSISSTYYLDIEELGSQHHLSFSSVLGVILIALTVLSGVTCPEEAPAHSVALINGVVGIGVCAVVGIGVCGVVGTELYILGIEEALCSSTDDVSNPVGTLGLMSFARIMARVVLLSSIPLPS